MSSDIRHALRTLTRRPSFALLVLITLAIGIGANTAIFSIVRAVILKPLPFVGPDRLVHIYENHPKGVRFKKGAGKYFIVVRPGTLYEWRTQSTSFESIEAYRRRPKTLSGSNGAQPVWAHEVTEGFFATTGVVAAHGRAFTPEDYAPGAPATVILSDRLWRTRFGGDTKMIGQTIQIDGASMPVIGIMPPGFYSTRFDRPDVWLRYEAASGDAADRVTWNFITLARLKAGVTFEHAHKEMDMISDRLSTAYPADYDNMSAVLVPVTDEIIGDYELLLYTLLGAVGVVLLVGCVNVANLMVSRGIERSQEFAVRTALGATRTRLIRQAVIESLLLSSAGGMLGLLVARLSLPAALSLLPADNVPRIGEVTLDWTVLAFTLAISTLAGLVCGVAPALRSWRTDINDRLKESGRASGPSRGTRWIGDVLVTSEIALALVLTIGAGLLLRSFVRLHTVKSGFDTGRVLSLLLTVPAHRYSAYEVGGANPKRAALYRDLARHVAETPGVESAAASALLPLRHGVNPWGISIEGRAPPAAAEVGGAAFSRREGLAHHGSVSIERVTPEYFRTLGVHLQRGRLIEERDTADAPLVTVVNETFVAKFFPNEDALGRRITVDMTSYFPKMTIVGVVEDNRMHGLDRDPYPLLYWSMSQLPSMNAWLLVRTHAAPADLAHDVRAAVNRIDGDIAVSEVASMENVLADSAWRQRFAAVLLAVFAALALLQAISGIYAVLSYWVSRRTQEMGLRMTLGATRREIIGMVLARGMTLAAAGIAVGIVVGLGLARLVGAMLYQVSPADPATFAAVPVALLGVAALACYVPARRATRVDPLVALRSE
jgi:putative ABC transport system permease protein